MLDATTMDAILNSCKHPFVFVDTNHIVQYMNDAAIRYYEEGVNLIGRPIFHCHTVQSNRMIVEIFAAFQSGDEERLITNNEKHRIYMRAVRDDQGQLLGYYERYEPSVKMTTSVQQGLSK
jgi:DUF438 domain-containing protein